MKISPKKETFRKMRITQRRVVYLTCFVLGFILLLNSVQNFKSSIKHLKSVSVIEQNAIAETTTIKQYPNRYVSLCRDRLTGDHRLGNHLFMLAAMLHVSKITGRTLVMPKRRWYLDKVFALNIKRFDDVEKEICPCSTIQTPRYDYDKRFDDYNFTTSLSNSNDSFLFCGLSQTYQYASKNELELRRLIKFHGNISLLSEKFLRNLGMTSMKVGVHVRRGDFMTHSESVFGLTVADSVYFHSAFKYFTDRYPRVHFVVATEDRAWSMANLPQNYSMTFMVNHTAAMDFAVLTKCDGIIMSTGSFGWWAAWLANKTTVYYKEYPKKNSAFYRELNQKNYFPLSWIPV